jgi:serine/threonine protein phosphatase PrpC
MFPNGAVSMLTVCSRTHPGTVRTINEDSSLWAPELGVIAVADGMGGHNAGEVASQLALDTLRAFLEKSASGDDFTWPFGIAPKLSFAANRLMTAIKIANHRVFRASEESSEYTGMGTTVVAALVDGAHLAYSGVGDSRIYSFDGARLRQITRDDSWVEMLMKESGLEASAFERHPMRHVLTSVVGARPELEVTVEELDLADGHTIMLCTDGLHGALKTADVEAVLKQESDLDRAAAQLVEMAVERDGKDNVTVTLARYAN